MPADAERSDVVPTSGEINHLTRGSVELCQPHHLPLFFYFTRGCCRYSNTMGFHSNVWCQLQGKALEGEAENNRGLMKKGSVWCFLCGHLEV